MTSFPEASNNPKQEKLVYCPDLGLKADPTTVLQYPSDWNYCHHVKRAKTPKLNHQRTFCLCANYENCPVFTAPRAQRLPKDIRYRRKISRKTVSTLSKVILALVLIGLLVAAFLNRNLIQEEVSSFLVPDWQKTQMAAPTITVTSNQLGTPTSLQLPTSTETPAATPTPPPTATPTRPAPVLDLGVPIGDEVRYVIYLVNEGDTLELIANRFNTTASAIRASTLFLPQVLWAELVVVVPVDLTDVEDLPIFDPYQVTVAQIEVETLAATMEIDLDDLIYYNHLWPGFQLRQGDWVLLPYERE